MGVRELGAAGSAGVRARGKVSKILPRNASPEVPEPAQEVKSNRNKINVAACCFLRSLKTAKQQKRGNWRITLSQLEEITMQTLSDEQKIFELSQIWKDAEYNLRSGIR